MHKELQALAGFKTIKCACIRTTSVTFPPYKVSIEVNFHWISFEKLFKQNFYYFIYFLCR